LDERLPDLAPRPTPPLLPTRRNIFDEDEFDQLAINTSRLHFGRRNPDETADDILRDRSTAPKKAAILSALATFDSDDDERDDTYDIEDVGGTVDSATPGSNPEEASADTSDTNDEALFRAFKMTPTVFDRDAATRRSKPRITLKEETGITDEAIEGWALMLSRDPRRMRRLEAKFSSFSGAQKELISTAWKADLGGSGTEESDGSGRAGRGAIVGPRGRGGRRRGGTGRGGTVTGPTGEKETEIARQRKEANKGSRANHNRRDQRARKMARGGFLP
jgi:activating signal cointegrator complex subunit 2